MSGYGEKKAGVQVVKVSQEPGRRYEVDEAALASVLLRPDVRGLPVVVVSVAGAYRGGKSFILDFFLRYLKASRQSQLSGEWLGKEEELLEGFDWRGGGETHTKGIHLWPEPFIVTNECTRQKMAVLLMDTQGTFDTESDMGDNSTIFALSTLLSSVQIYNLRANIGEDDLQHLQLFTEYGRLVCGGEGKAFQTLQFLVRDWMSPYEHPYGYEGGQTLMDIKLAPKPNQKKQLREVRDHIHSCFENLTCFLMPHPGLIVAHKDFRGRLCDINEQFRMLLLELVPSLFDPSNLAVKLINGDKIQAQSLLEFFKRYIEIFNSDDLPEATTIFQATADAWMMSALRECRTKYESMMESNVTEDQSVSTSVMQEWHRAAVAAAIDHYHGKKKLGSQDNVASHLADLEKELDARLLTYLWQNDAKVRDTVSAAKKCYEDEVHSVCTEQTRLCVHSADLRRLHDAAMAKALTVFDDGRGDVPVEGDTDRMELIENLNQYYQHLCTVNEQNNRAATLEARNIYVTRMKDNVPLTGASSEVLQKQHDKSLSAAINHFHSLRNLRTEEAHDPDEERLRQDIMENFAEFEKANIHNNLGAMQMAEYTYNNYMTSAWGPQSCCFHPRALDALHEKGEEAALERFFTDRVPSEEDDYKYKLVEKLQTRYEELQGINNFNNQESVDQAFGEYTRRMDKHTEPGLSSIFIIPFFVKLVKSLPAYHEKSRRIALDFFEKRRRGGSYDEDEYLDDLKEKMFDAYARYRNPAFAMLREVGLHHLLPNTDNIFP